MGTKWKLQDAKNRFSEVVNEAARSGPQIVTRHGEEVAVVVSAATYRRLSGSEKDFKAFLLTAPDLSKLDIRRSPERPRPVDL